MHPEIELTQKLILDLYTRQRRYLDAKPTPFLEDLKHQAKDEISSDTFTARTAAKINHAAAVIILEARALSLNPQPSTQP